MVWASQGWGEGGEGGVVLSSQPQETRGEQPHSRGRGRAARVWRREGEGPGTPAASGPPGEMAWNVGPSGSEM